MQNVRTVAVPHLSQCERQQEAEQIKTPTLILVWWVFPEPQLTELTGETESITQNPLSSILQVSSVHTTFSPLSCLQTIQELDLKSSFKPA